MYNGLLHAHSGLRWVVLFAAIYAIVKAYEGKTKNAPFTGAFKSSASLFVASMHVQFLLGLVLYLQSPWFQALKNNASAVMKDSTLRFFAIEHISMMLVAVVMATVGNAVSKKAKTPSEGYRKRVIWFTIVLIIMLAAIPWPFRFANSHWF